MLDALLGIGASLLSGSISSNAKKSAAKSASRAEIEAQERAIEEQRRQFESIRKDLSPFLEAGQKALGQQLGLLGIGDEGIEQETIESIKAGPLYKSLVREGEEAILQSRSATGGLRGGNIQESLAEFRPSVLSGLLNQRYSQLGGLSTLGQQAGAQTGAFGQQSASNISGMIGDIGRSKADRALALGQADAQFLPQVAQSLGQLGSLGGIF